MIDDLDRIMQVMDAAFDPQWGEAWTRRQVSDSLAFLHTHYRLVDEQGESPTDERDPAGFTLVRAAPGEEELLLVGVVPSARGKGLGRTLIQSAIADARSRKAERLFLEARRNNPAIDLYARLGFQKIGERKGYYNLPSGERMDAVTFAFTL